MTASRTALSLMLLSCASDEMVSPLAGADDDGGAAGADEAGADAAAGAAAAGVDAGVDDVVAADEGAAVDAVRGGGVVGVPTHEDVSPASVLRSCQPPSAARGSTRAGVVVVVVVVVVSADRLLRALVGHTSALLPASRRRGRVADALQ